MRFPITQTEYDCPAQREHGPMWDTLLWLLKWAFACLLVLTASFLWVLLL